MKRRILVAMMFVLGLCSVQAQQGAENWEEMRAERVKKQAERKAGELELKGDAKDNFIIIFTQYQNDMFSSARKSGLFENMRGRNNEPEKKELTDAEAKEKVENYFKGQENQIKLMQTRLQIQRKYYAEFAKTLTPQQLAKVFEDQPMRQMNGRRRPGGPAGFGTHP